MQNLFSFRETPFWKYCFRRLFFFLPSRGVAPKRWTFCRFCFGKALTVRRRRFVGEGNCRGDRHWNRHLPRSITPPLKHLADCSIAAKTAWRRPRRSRGSPQVWNCVPANFCKTLGSGWFLSCGRTSCGSSGLHLPVKSGLCRDSLLQGTVECGAQRSWRTTVGCLKTSRQLHSRTFWVEVWETSSQGARPPGVALSRLFHGSLPPTTTLSCAEHY
jgi:hypothetical protein